MAIRTGVLAMLIACTTAPLYAATSAKVTIGAPVILVDALDPDPAAPPAHLEGGYRVDDFHHYLSPAPVGNDVGGHAAITQDTEQAIGGRTDGPGSYFVAVGDRYAPSFTFTATGRTRVTVQSPFTLSSSIDGEPFHPDDPARTGATFELMVAAFNNFAVDASGNLHYDLLAVEHDVAELFSPLDADASGPRRLDGVLSVSFDNLSDQPAVFAFRGQMVAWGVSAPTHAPEPASIALMLAGLGTIGVVVQRRRRNDQSASVAG